MMVIINYMLMGLASHVSLKNILKSDMTPDWLIKRTSIYSPSDKWFIIILTNSRNISAIKLV